MLSIWEERPWPQNILSIMEAYYKISVISTLMGGDSKIDIPFLRECPYDWSEEAGLDTKVATVSFTRHQDPSVAPCAWRGFSRKWSHWDS